MRGKAKLNLNKRFPTLGNREGWREAAEQPGTGVTRMDRHPALAEDTVETPGTDQHLNANGHCSGHCFPTHWGTQAATHSKDFQPQLELGCSNVPGCPPGQLTARNKAASAARLWVEASVCPGVGTLSSGLPEQDQLHQNLTTNMESKTPWESFAVTSPGWRKNKRPRKAKGSTECGRWKP